MPHCPNPDCPYVKSIGRPAEFQEGTTHCSDCGSMLSEAINEKAEIQKMTGKFAFTDLQKRVLYTIGFVLLWRVLVVIPIPGIDFQVFRGLSGNDHLKFSEFFFGDGHGLERVSIIALGMIPYFYTYMIVEILSVFIQPLKSWRTEGIQGRIKIREVALFATFLLALLHGYGLAQGLEGMLGPVGEKIVRNPGLTFRLISALTFTAGTFLTVWIAELITRKGIGHGISILILTGFAPNFLANIAKTESWPHKDSLLEHYLFRAMVVIASIALIVLMEKSHRRIAVRFDDGTEAHIPLKFTSAGIMPAEWASTLIMLPTTALLLVNNKASSDLAGILWPTSIGGAIIYFAVTIILYYLFTSFFYDPKKLAFFLKNKQASIVSSLGKDEESYMDRSLECMIPLAAIYLCVVVFVPNAILAFSINRMGGIDLIAAVAILLDLTAEVRIRRKGEKLVKVAELHDVAMAGLLKSILEQKGLSCCLRGYYHRALLYFFGPYIEISVLVPENRITEAKETIEKYLDGNILTLRPAKATGLQEGDIVTEAGVAEETMI